MSDSKKPTEVKKQPVKTTVSTKTSAPKKTVSENNVRPERKIKIAEKGVKKEESNAIPNKSLQTTFFEKYVMDSKEELVVYEGGLGELAGYQNQGVNQEETAKYVTEMMKGMKTTLETTVAILYCYGKSGIDDKTQVKVNDKYSKVYKDWFDKAKKYMIKELGKDEDKDEKERDMIMKGFNETLLIRCWALTRILVIREIIKSFEHTKLYASNVIPFVFDIDAKIFMLESQLAQMRQAETYRPDPEKMREKCPFTKPFSLYFLVKTPNPKEVTFNRYDITVIMRVLRSIGTYVGVDVKGEYEKLKGEVNIGTQIISKLDLNKRWRAKFDIFNSGGRSEAKFKVEEFNPFADDSILDDLELGDEEPYDSEEEEGDKKDILQKK